MEFMDNFRGLGDLLYLISHPWSAVYDLIVRVLKYYTMVALEKLEKMKQLIIYGELPDDTFNSLPPALEDIPEDISEDYDDEMDLYAGNW